MIFALVAIVAFLCEAVLHWFPWQRLIGQPCPRLVAYVLGVLAIAAPVTVALALEAQWFAAALLWAAIGAGGFAVVVGYALDTVLTARGQAYVRETSRHDND